jgi:hypothetical protein
MRKNQKMREEIQDYNDKQSVADKEICDLLEAEISKELTEGENKIWHAHPVWFLEGNPIVGYDKLKNCVRLMFWSGKSFDEPNFECGKKFQDASMRYTGVDQINVNDLRRWLKKSREIQWDYKNIMKRKGRLERLK